MNSRWNIKKSLYYVSLKCHFHLWQSLKKKLINHNSNSKTQNKTKKLRIIKLNGKNDRFEGVWKASRVRKEIFKRRFEDQLGLSLWNFLYWLQNFLRTHW